MLRCLERFHVLVKRLNIFRTRSLVLIEASVLAAGHRPQQPPYGDPCP